MQLHNSEAENWLRSMSMSIGLNQAEQALYSQLNLQGPQQDESTKHGQRTREQYCVMELN